MRPHRPKRRTVRVGFRLTKAEQKLVKQCRQADEVFSETCRRLLLWAVRDQEYRSMPLSLHEAADLLMKKERPQSSPDPE